MTVEVRDDLVLVEEMCLMTGDFRRDEDGDDSCWMTEVTRDLCSRRGVDVAAGGEDEVKRTRPRGDEDDRRVDERRDVDEGLDDHRVDGEVG